MNRQRILCTLGFVLLLTSNGLAELSLQFQPLDDRLDEPRIGAFIANNGPSPVSVSGYSISSPSGQLDPNDWSSVEGFVSLSIVSDLLCGAYLPYDPLGPQYFQFRVTKRTSVELAESTQGEVTWPAGHRLPIGSPFSGALDQLPGDLRFVYFRAHDPHTEVSAPIHADGTPFPHEADFNDNLILDFDDIDLLSFHVRASSNKFELFDLNGDMVVNEEDRRIWVQDIKRTTFGDSNLDHRFSSTDLVESFQAAEYEDGIRQNSTWVDGDWNGDAEFSSEDLTLAFQSGRYEQAPITGAQFVPEPTGVVLLLVGLALTMEFAWRPRNAGQESGL